MLSQWSADTSSPHHFTENTGSALTQVSYVHLLCTVTMSIYCAL